MLFGHFLHLFVNNKKVITHKLLSYKNLDDLLLLSISKTTVDFLYLPNKKIKKKSS